MATTNVPQWLQTATKKQKIRDDAIHQFVIDRRDSSLPLSKLHDSVTVDNIPEILQAISSGSITASKLLEVYIHRAIDAHKRTNCLTEILFSDAVKQAKQLDDYFDEHGRLLGPLHGVPMTLKDQFDVQGYDSSIGYVGRAFKPVAQDCVLVALLKDMGAIIVAKSNLPQSIMWCETDNPLWGLTVHPQNPALTPGGSTGGEGALLSLRGAVIGWGTDIGGSVRIPAHMNGLYALKPSSTRLPYQGVSVSTEGQEHVPSVIGPMSGDIDSLVSVTKAILDCSPWNRDPKCCPVPWRWQMFEAAMAQPLIIAVMRDDGVVKPHPPISRVLDDVVQRLEAAGHEIVPWMPGDIHQECVDIMDQFYTVDGGEDIRNDVKAGGEPFIPHVEALINKGQPISVYEYWQLNKRKFATQKRFFHLWNATKSPITGKQIDILLTPVMPHSAVPHGKCRWVGYTKVFNFIDYPAVVVPAGQVSKELDAAKAKMLPSYHSRNALDEWNQSIFDLNAMDGMPIGVQIVARRLQEEKVLGAAKAIDMVLKGAGTKIRH